MPAPPANAAPLLAVAAAPHDAEALAEALRAAGERDVLTADCLALVQALREVAPRAAVCVLPLGAHELSAALAPFEGVLPCAVLVCAPLADADAARALADAGVAAWLPRLDAGVLPQWLALAQAQHARAAALRAAGLEARTQLDERKWVDRAKGLLMGARGIAEDDAFKLLRGAAMHANLKLGEVSRAVVDAARWAEAVNRAGQLRMLSQRLVALAAQRLARIDTNRARAQHEAAARRVDDNLAHLAALPLQGDAAAALAAVQAEWEPLREALARRLTSDTLLAADARAEALLEGADRLTAALQASGARPTLAVVNRCGSQRMRAQRVAKEALLSRLVPAHAGTAAAATAIPEFERVLAEIESAPLSSPEIRAALAASREGWLALLRGLRAGDPALLVRSSEALLGHLDELTESCEHSLQVLMS